MPQIKQTERHNIDDGLYVYKQSNSTRWQARFVLNGKWYLKSTKRKDLQAAILKAVQLQTEYRIMLSNQIPVHKSRKTQTHLFGAIMKLAIKRMDAEEEEGDGKVVYKDYKRALEKYYKPYFEKMHIKEICDQQRLIEFDKWRTEQMGKTPSKSTLLTHNSALQRVLDEAVIQKYITASELPKLKNTGVKGERRAAFTKQEFKAILEETKKKISESRKKITHHIRNQLYRYIQIAAYTGIRPGTELEQLTWGDVNEREINDKNYLAITVRKGKTTKYTGTREIICKDEVSKVIADMLSYLQEYKNDNYYDPSDNELLFTHTKEYTVTFRKILEELKLRTHAHGDRSLYSLRHSYITWELEAGTKLRVIASQCGTSEDMIEQHYKHLVPAMFAEELSGRKKEQNELKPINFEGTGTLVLKDGLIVVEH